MFVFSKHKMNSIKSFIISRTTKDHINKDKSEAFNHFYFNDFLPSIIDKVLIMIIPMFL